MTTLIPVIVGVAGLIVGAALSYFIAFSGAKSKAKRLLAEAEAQGEVMKKNKLLEVKEKFLNKKAELEKEVAARSQKLQQAESRIKQRELQLNQQQSENQRRRNEVDAIKANLENQMKIVGEKQVELDKLSADGTI
jgi:ribonuclease Y